MSNDDVNAASATADPKVDAKEATAAEAAASTAEAAPAAAAAEAAAAIPPIPPAAASNKKSWRVGEDKYILDSILDHIGNTPLVRINSITNDEKIECELLAKCEFFNAGGSVKDRIGKRMVLDAEKSGRIKPGDTLIEPTSGNTGIGLSLTAALKGYHMIITLPEKMSKEKVDVLKGLGAEIIRTPTEAAFDAPESHIGVAKHLNATLPNSHVLDQYSNPSNPNAHYYGTAQEIYNQCEGKLDMIVISAGTGGTIAGTAKRLKELIPDLIVCGVDPKGSILAQPECLNDEMRLQSYQVEGIGYDFIPEVCDRSLIDFWVKTEDKESFLMARRMIKQEGLLCGGSSGAAMAGALKAIRQKKLGKGKRCVVLLADSVRNYMTKFLSESWMVENNYIESTKYMGLWWSDKKVTELQLNAPVILKPTVTNQVAIEIMKKMGIDQVPVVTEGHVLGVVTMGNLTSKLLTAKIGPDSLVNECLFTGHKIVGISSTLGELATIFDTHHFALICTSQKMIGPGNTFTNTTTVTAVVTRVDLLTYLTSHTESS